MHALLADAATLAPMGTVLGRLAPAWPEGMALWGAAARAAPVAARAFAAGLGPTDPLFWEAHAASLSGLTPAEVVRALVRVAPQADGTSVGRRDFLRAGLRLIGATGWQALTGVADAATVALVGELAHETPVAPQGDAAWNEALALGGLCAWAGHLLPAQRIALALNLRMSGHWRWRPAVLALVDSVFARLVDAAVASRRAGTAALELLEATLTRGQLPAAHMRHVVALIWRFAGAGRPLEAWPAVHCLCASRDAPVVLAAFRDEIAAAGPAARVAVRTLLLTGLRIETAAHPLLGALLDPLLEVSPPVNLDSLVEVALARGSTCPMRPGDATWRAIVA